MTTVERMTNRGAVEILAAVLLLTGALGAQTKRGGTETDMYDQRSAGVAVLPAAQPRGPAMESTISPEQYVVGPSDVFAVNIWSSAIGSYQLTVTPEGTLIVPSVGEFPVASLTLAEVKKRIVAEIKRRYLSGTVDVTLLVPRSVIISVIGNVLHPGAQVMAASQRVDKAVEEANKPRPAEDSRRTDELRLTTSTRRITVRHRDGSQSRVDLQKFLATKDEQWNPYLREGDVIVVPEFDIARNVFGVYGDVNVPGRYEFVAGDSVKDALKIAYGFTATAREDSVELSRQDRNSLQMTTRLIDARAILDGRAPNFPLEPGDRLLVRGQPDQRGDYRVRVMGEVVFPGVYPITRRSTRLAEVIAKAGGFTEFAWLGGAELLRQSVAQRDIELERIESIRGGVPPEDSSYFYLETDLKLRKEVVNVDFLRLYSHGDSTQNVPLRSEDIIVIPSSRQTIYVFGQVVNPGHVPFLEGRDVWFYINQAGGATDRARKGDIKIVKAKTRQWLAPGDTELEQGDFVWVPKEYERPFGYYLGVIAQSAAIISAAVSIVLLVIQINK
jgi:protein involved in polysaccharide export with SLBB domain